jgi:hypothetical protein
MPSADDRAHGGCLFGPRVRFPDAHTDLFYTYPVTSNTASLVLAAMTHRWLASIVARLPAEPRRGRPWSRPLHQRVLIACAALRTNLTMRELGACFGVSKSTAHRIVSTVTPTARGPRHAEVEERSVVVQRADLDPPA